MNNYYSQNNAGFTLLELLVAMSISAIIMSIVFYSWGTINKHTIIYGQKSAFSTSAQLMALSIITDIRRSPKVLAINPDGILFVSRFGDTVSYTFSDQSLQRNKTACPLPGPTMSCTGFSIEEINSSTLYQSSLVQITIAFADSRNNSATFSLLAHINYIPVKGLSDPFSSFP